MFTAAIRLALLLSFVPLMFVLSLLHERSVPESYVARLDDAWSTFFPEE